MKKLKKKSPRGRKLFDGKGEIEVVGKLESVFTIGGTDKEACLVAGISLAALYDYQKLHPEFLYRKELLKESMIVAARQSVANAIKDHPELALKYLERKRRDEFALIQRLEHSGPNGKPIATNTTLIPSVDFKGWTKEELLKAAELKDPNDEDALT